MPVASYIFIILSLLALFPSVVLYGFADEAARGDSINLFTVLVIFSPQILTIVSVVLICFKKTSKIIVFLPLFCIPPLLGTLIFAYSYY
jgi:hypothetical protein